MSFQPILPSQHKLIQSQEKLNALVCEPAAGATYALCLKAIHEAQTNDKYVLLISSSYFSEGNGGVLDILFNILCEEGYRYSRKSTIITFKDKGRIKVVRPVKDEAWVGESFDWVLADHRSEYITRALQMHSKHIAFSIYPDQFYSDPLMQYNVIKMKSEDNVLFEDSEKYLKLAKEAIPQHFF